LQARLLYVSPDRQEIQVGFHNEPVVALAALDIFCRNAHLVVRQLSQDLRHCAMGPIGEIAGMLVRFSYDDGFCACSQI
jgi:hypothetical protein